ncbi:hypothetical protein HII12_000415 [Brettanomyces bruxellensis]|uniref:NADH dehydrogenase [ubiquinone] 1 alpha subcomplex subunit 13 n=1 Tax=Dekkera bruxellensis TaxID=5007 RepID=A0A8H6BQF1_DEKBR|nr:hypothetical protein HII12_000415 [Brettanomyces bruxellensis]
MGRQDLPPIKGYEPIQWKRNLPSRGFRPSIWLGMLIGLSSYGKISNFQEKKLWARINLIPLLQAEQDRDVVRRTLSYYNREAEIMKDVPWWEVRNTYSDKNEFQPPHTVLVGKQLDKNHGIYNGNSRNRWGPDDSPKKETSS